MKTLNISHKTCFKKEADINYSKDNTLFEAIKLKDNFSQDKLKTGTADHWAKELQFYLNADTLTSPVLLKVIHECKVNGLSVHETKALLTDIIILTKPDSKWHEIKGEVYSYFGTTIKTPEIEDFINGVMPKPHRKTVTQFNEYSENKPLMQDLGHEYKLNHTTEFIINSHLAITYKDQALAHKSLDMLSNNKINITAPVFNNIVIKLQELQGQVLFEGGE